MDHRQTETFRVGVHQLSTCSSYWDRSKIRINRKLVLSCTLLHILGGQFLLFTQCRLLFFKNKNFFGGGDAS